MIAVHFQIFAWFAKFREQFQTPFKGIKLF